MDLSTTTLNTLNSTEFDLFSNSGICTKVFPTIRYSPNGDPYINGLLDIGNGKEKVFLICLSEESDFTPEISMLLEGQKIILQRKGTGDLFIKYIKGLPEDTKSFILKEINKTVEEENHEESKYKFDKNSLLENLSKRDLVMIIQSLRTLLFIPFEN